MKLTIVQMDGALSTSPLIAYSKSEYKTSLQPQTAAVAPMAAMSAGGSIVDSR